MTISRDGLVFSALSTALFMLILSIVFGNPLQSRRNHLQSRKPVQDCTTDLAGDLYGLGVRLGVYFQWWSGWVANNFVVDEISGALDANAIFLFALIISLVSSTRTDDMTLMDGFIMLMLCAGTVWSVLSLWGYRTCVYRKEEHHDGIKRFGGFGTHLRLLLGTSVCCYALWFWTIGTRGLPYGLSQFGDVDESCKRETVMVWNLPISGAASKIGLALTSIAAVHTVIATLSAPIAGVTRLMKLIHFVRHRMWASSTRLRFATGANQKQLTVASWVLCAINMAWILFTMMVIELALNENCIEAVIGANMELNNFHIVQPSQLIPLLIGAFSFVRMLFMTFELWRAPDGDITPSLGRHKSRRNRQSSKNATKGMNIFKLFSSGSSMSEEPESYQKTPQVRNEQDEYYFNLHERLGFWQRVLITWLPWFSLFWFWPWTKDFERVDSSDEDTIALKSKYRYDSVSLTSPTKSRTVTWEDEVDKGAVRVSEAEMYDSQYPRNSV